MSGDDRVETRRANPGVRVLPTTGIERGLGPLAALLWIAACLRWFDTAALWRPAWLAAIPAAAVIAPATIASVWWFSRAWRRAGAQPMAREERLALGWVLAISFAFRLPLAWHGAAGYTTPDAALSGIVALHVRDGIDRLVFVPHVPYSGSLKSHLTALTAFVIDPARAFALASVVFYLAFVAAVFRLARMARPDDLRPAVGAALYLACAPAFVTRYSLSNDGNYVEVLAFGTWALVWASRHDAPLRRPLQASLIGVLLGLGFWCHILGLIPAAAVALLIATRQRFGCIRALPRLVLGFALGYFPGLLWNAANRWQSLDYVLPGGAAVGSLDAGPGWPTRALKSATDLLPVLVGYDHGYPGAIDAALLIFSIGVLGLVTMAATDAARDALRQRTPAVIALLVLAACNLAIAIAALPYLPGNPRYLLFLSAPVAVFLGLYLAHGWRRKALVAVIVLGAFGSLAQAPATLRSDGQWRAFVADLTRLGIRHCHTDFYLATKINFLSEEHIVCSAKLGPTTTEYFFEYRERAERARDAALIAVNPTAADKLGRRLERLGVGYRRDDLMKPVLHGFTRPVDPEELFPDRDFPLR